MSQAGAARAAPIDIRRRLPYRRCVGETSKIPLLVRLIWKIERWRGRVALPAGRTLGGLLFYGRPLLITARDVLMQALIREPALRYRCRTVGKGLRLYGPAPRIIGDGVIDIGDEVQFGEDMSFVVGAGLPEPAHLEIKSHITFLGHQVVYVARRVSIGNYCLIGGSIYDNDAHPIDPVQRRHRFAEMSTIKSAPVILEDDVWVGLNALVLKGVTVHQGAIVAAGAVVTKDVPPFTVVAGNPARVIRQLPEPVGESPRHVQES